jgi:hypothetical protein
MTELKSEQLYDRFITFLLYNGKGGTYGRLLDNPKRDFVAKLILSMGKDNPVVRMNREVLILFFLNRLGSFWLKMIAYGELKQENYTASVTLAVPGTATVRVAGGGGAGDSGRLRYQPADDGLRDTARDSGATD